MKIIDIYNKVAKGEEVPHFIIDEQEYYIGADGVLKSYFGDEVEWRVHKDWLNEEVKIIEEKPKHIEELKDDNSIWEEQSKDIDYIFKNKINELRKAVNYLLDKEGK
jgi:hypothetical protein